MNPFTPSDYLQHLNQAAIITDLVGHIRFWNDAATRVYGWTRDEVMFKNVIDLIPTQQTKEQAAEIMKELSLGHSWSGEFMVERKNGDSFPAFVTNLPYFDEEHQLTGIIGISSDLSQQKESERQLQLLLDNTEESFILLDAAFNITSFNKQAIIGTRDYIGADLVMGSTILNYSPPSQQEQLKAALNSVLQGQVLHAERAFRDGEGKSQNYLAKYSPARNDAGEIVGIFVSAKNITTQKKSESALVANEARWQALVENIQDIFLILDDKGLVVYVSPSIKTVLQFEASDLEDKKLIEFFNQEDKKEIQKILDDCLLQPGITKMDGQVRMKNKAGAWIWMESSVTNLLHDEHVGGIVFTARDVTELVKQSADLKKERENKDALINATDDLIWSINEEYELIAANNSFLGALKKSTGILLQPGDSLMRQDKFTAAWLSYWKSLYGKAFEGESFKEEIYTPATVNNSRDSWAEISFNPLWQQSKVVGIACYSHNITDRKKREESDKEAAINQSVYSAIVNASGDAILSKNLDGIVTSWNKGAERIFGYSAAEIIGNPVTTIIPADLMAEEAYILRQVKSKKPVSHYETERVDKQGNRKTVSISVSPIIDIDGKVVGASKIARDITQQKKDALMLRQQDARLKGIINSQSNYIIRTDMEGRYSYYNDKFFEDFGWIHNNENLIGKHGMESIMPSHHQLVMETIEKCIAQPNKVFQVEIDKPFLDGSIKTTFWDFICLTDLQGKPVEMQCVGIDITQRVQAERELLQSLEDRNLILESIGDAFFAVDKNWITTYWNKNAETMLGVTREEVIGKDIWTIFPQQITTINFTNFQEALDKNEIKHYESYYPQTGEWYEVSLYPSAKGLSIYFRDVTERKKADNLLKDSIERFNLASLATSDIIWDWNLITGQVTRSDKNVLRVFGYDKNADINSFDFWMTKVHPDDKDGVNRQFEETFANASQNFMDSEYRFKKADGSYAYVYDKGYIVRDKAGRPRRMIGAVQDITRLKENELLLQNKAQELALSNRDLEQFAFVASHDLQEPLRMITSFLTKLSKTYENSLDERANTYINFAVDGATRMRRIILDLLEYSRVGRTKTPVAVVNLTEIVEEIELLFKQTVEELGAVINYKELPVVHTHRAPMRQLLQNLISNALNFTKPGVSPVIQITAAENATHFTIAVKDNGIGIEEDYFEKIFIIFQRLHTRDEYEGSGIGLSIAKKIVEAMGGKIWVESTRDQGSTFYFTIPKQARPQ